MDSTALGKLLTERLAKELKAGRIQVYDVTRFVGVAETTVQAWTRPDLATHRPPRGERLNGLWQFLATAGVKSPELDAVHDFGRYLGQLMAFRLVDLEEAQRVCGINHQQGVHNTTRGQIMPENPGYSLEELKELYDADLQDRIKALRDQLAGDAVSKNTVPVTADEPAAPQLAATAVSIVPVGDPAAFRHQLVVNLTERLGAILPLLQYALSEQCTPEERAIPRTILGPDVMFLLARGVTALSGTRAYNESR